MKVSQLLKTSLRREENGDSGSKKWGTPEQISFPNWASNRKMSCVRTVLGQVEAEGSSQPLQERALGQHGQHFTILEVLLCQASMTRG